MAGIYLHIPFCKQQCHYCNFHFSTSLRGKDDLLLALHKEIKLQRDFFTEEIIETVYFGGGTPSLLHPDEISRLLEALHEQFSLQLLQECTLEANPDDLTSAYLRALKQTGINRLSIGVQSFHDADLRYMNRVHDAQEADAAIKRAQDVGFENITIDLIYGTPGLTDAAWKTNLLKVHELSLPHFSAYALTVEEGTVLQHRIKTNKTPPVLTEQAAAQFDILSGLSADVGYEHYEISNLALPGCYARHNTAYWQGKPYLGLGPSAHSFDGKATRQWNVANNALYTQALLQRATIEKESEILQPRERLNEYIMTSIRTQWGCQLEHITAQWGVEEATALKHRADRFIDEGKLTIDKETLRLTQAGKLYADGIASDLFA